MLATCVLFDLEDERKSGEKMIDTFSSNYPLIQLLLDVPREVRASEGRKPTSEVLHIPIPKYAPSCSLPIRSLRDDAARTARIAQNLTPPAR